MFAVFAALALGLAYIGVRMLSAPATGAQCPISILLLLVLPATLLFGLNRPAARDRTEREQSDVVRRIGGLLVIC